MVSNAVTSFRLMQNCRRNFSLTVLGSYAKAAPGLRTPLNDRFAFSYLDDKLFAPNRSDYSDAPADFK
jgi:hypothetical protein